MTKNEMLLKENILYCKAYQEQLSKLNNKIILVAGASGLIGSHLVNLLLTFNENFGGTIKIITLGRNKSKLEAKFPHNIMLEHLESDYNSYLEIKCDYVINCASNTSSESFINTPVNTILDNVKIMDFTLNIAKNNNAKYLYTSSQEIYGNPYDNQTIFEENELGYLATNDVRNSYPETKRISELLVCSYAHQYGIKTNSVRLGKCYALNSDISDKRIIADFTRKASNKEDLILKTDGKMRSTFAYILDIVAGMIYVLTECYDNDIYNIGSENSNYSIKEITEVIANLGGVNILFNIQSANKTGYSKVSHMLLSLDKIHSKGWKGLTTLKDGITKIFKYNKLS